MVAIEALYIFDEHNNAILEHVYAGRPPSAATLLPAYLSNSTARPPVTYLPNVNPPTLVCSTIQDRLLFLCPSSSDVEPLEVLEFLHRVADALEEFLGAPLLASKIDASYDVVAQIVSEIADAGIVATTEPNALREVVEAPNWMGSLFGGLGLPASSPSLQTPSSIQRPASPLMPGTGNSSVTSSSGTAIPWRRANVRHTSNELYVDLVEKLSVVTAPSGRPLSAIAYGTILFNAKISGVPDLMLNLSAPGGKIGIRHAMDLPSFHPCVRLARWRERPGELSFVPPDGKFVLASYESNLLPELFESGTDKMQSPKLSTPISIQTRTAQGPYGDEFELRFFVNTSASPSSNSTAANSLNRNLANTARFGPSSGFGAGSAQSGPPPLEDISVKIPISTAVKNVDDLKTATGEAHYLPGEGNIEWRISSKEASMIGSNGAALRCTITRHSSGADDYGTQSNGLELKTNASDYDEDSGPTIDGETSASRPTASRIASSDSLTAMQKQQSAALMPRSATVSFTLRGWLASGIKVDGLTVNTKTSRGLGSGVTPYKGVKYHTVSRDGVEVRC